MRNFNIHSTLLITTFFIVLMLNLPPAGGLLIAAQVQDTTKDKPVQYRRGIELKEGYQTYQEKYSGKNLNEVKRSLFPLQDGTGVWTELNPGVPRVTYLGVHFTDSETGWVVGDLGAIIKTTDGGDDWTVSETNTTTLLLKVHSFDGQMVIATGYDGLILRSTDGGETFVEVESGLGSGTDLWGVQMLNDTLGFVCGLNQTLLKTTDAGITWQQVTTGLNEHYWAIDFIDEQYGMIACGNGKILKTTEGGANWTQKQAGDTRALYTIDIIDSLHIAAAGANSGMGSKNVYSMDGGDTWLENDNLIYENGVNCISFINTDTGYAIGEYWGVWKTNNRGENWYPSGPNVADWQMIFLPERIGYAVGNELKVSKTTNSYEDWEEIFFRANLSDVFFINENKGFSISFDEWKLYKTTDGGISWDSIPGIPGGSEVYFIDSLTGFVGSNIIYKTTDGGESWYATNGSGGASKIFFINNSIGWAIYSGTIYKTTNAGENWTEQHTLPADSYTSIYFLDSLNGWATSRYIWQTTDGGDNWIERIDIPIDFSDDIYFPVTDTGWIARRSSINSSLFRTTDGGQNWIEIPEVLGSSIFYLFPDKAHWLTTGSIIQNNIVYKTYITYDSGNNWIEISENIPSGFSGFSAVTNTLGFAVGYSGLILRYVDTTYIPVELTSFEGSYTSNKIYLYWTTASEINNYGFEVWRSSNSINWKKIGFVEGNGSTTKMNSYSFIDNNLNGDNFYYKLKQIDLDGSYNFSDIINVTTQVKDFELMQNYPNPFNPTTTIKYGIRENSKVKLEIFDILGRRLTTLVDKNQTAGYYEVSFNAGKFASGVYIYRLTAKDFVSAKKMLLIK